MDTGEGAFELYKKLQDLEAAHSEANPNCIFSVGEEVTVKDSRFRVVKITPKKLTLRLLKRQDEEAM
jgi:uncharacterized Zn finger protein